MFPLTRELINGIAHTLEFPHLRRMGFRFPAVPRGAMEIGTLEYVTPVDAEGRRALFQFLTLFRDAHDRCAILRISEGPSSAIVRRAILRRLIDTSGHAESAR